jgi:gliding motility-associated-like protein
MALKVMNPGKYSLRISNQYGCATTGYVDVHKDCYMDIPNVFSPNGDGINDYFFPRQWLSRNTKRFNMQVYNRWGQVVFETNSLEGRGWDGRFNGIEQAVGVYMYRLEVLFPGGYIEYYDGNVTLVR